MATRARSWIGWCAVVLLAASARGGDVSVQLDSGAGFSLKNSTGTVERLRVDEATGNVSRNGALFVHTTGFESTFVGDGAGQVSSAPRQTAMGDHALRASSGADNSAFGARALFSNTNGYMNTAIGSQSLFYNSSGRHNTAIGANAMTSNTTGRSNTAVGFDALRQNNYSYNAAFGSGAMRANTTGEQNAAFGYGALGSNTDGSALAAFGSTALFNNTTGDDNTGIGLASLFSNSQGHRNTAVGSRSGMFATGSDNTGIGHKALHLASGSRNLAVGANAGANVGAGNDNIYLAHVGFPDENNTIRIGDNSTQTRAFVAGIRGVTTANANAIPVLIDSAGQLGTVSSSQSVKKDIRDMGDATARLLELRPVTFRYRQEQTLPGGGEVPPEYGLIAEEVAEVFPDLVVYDEEGRPFSVKYHELSPMLLNELQKQQRLIAAQNARIEQLERAVADR